MDTFRDFSITRALWGPFSFAKQPCAVCGSSVAPLSLQVLWKGISVRSKSGGQKTTSSVKISHLHPSFIRLMICFHRPRFCMHKFTGVIFDFRLWHECFLKWIGMPRSAPPLTETLLHPTVLFVKRRFGKFCSNFFVFGCFFGSDWLLE